MHRLISVFSQAERPQGIIEMDELSIDDFDLEEDPTESKNVAAMLPHIVTSMRARLAASSRLLDALP